jgi:hypothetical protein
MWAAVSAVALSAAVLSSTSGRVDRARYKILVVPAGTTLSLSLTSAISSKTSVVEDRVRARLRRAIVVQGVTVVPAGATISGRVVEATRSGRVKGRARVGVRFTALRAGDGRHTICTVPITREAPDPTRRDTENVAIAAGAAAIVGAVTGGTQGAAVGGAIGAAAGTGLALATRSADVEFAAGTTVTTTLMAPLTIRLRVP